MPIISVSLSHEMLNQLDYLQKDLGFTGRSELLRAGVRMMLADKREKDDLSGIVECVLAVTHDKEKEDWVTSIKHEFDEIVKAHLHYRVSSKKCLELFVLEGDAAKVKELAITLQRSEGMDRIKLLLN